jgi:hypothetical protein
VKLEIHYIFESQR